MDKSGINLNILATLIKRLSRNNKRNANFRRQFLFFFLVNKNPSKWMAKGVSLTFPFFPIRSGACH